MLMFQRSVGFAHGYMADIVAEQRDLLEATEASQPEQMKVLHARLFFNKKYLQFREDGGDFEYLREKYYGRGKTTSEGLRE